MKEFKRLVGVGLSTWDLLFRVSGPINFENNTDVISFNQEGGGPAATGTVAASKLGAESYFIGNVSDDFYGKMIVEDLERYGVNTDGVVVEDKDPNICVCLVNEADGERTFLGTSGTGLKKEDIKSGLIEDSDYLLIDTYRSESALRAAEVANKNDVNTIADIELIPKNVDRIISMIDILIVPENFLFQFMDASNDEKNALKGLREMGPEIVIATKGARGSIGFYEETFFQKPSFPQNVVDTTGAGDVFHGAFAVGHMMGWEVEPVTEFASAVSSISCTALGGRSGIPSLDETIKFLSENSSNWNESGPIEKN